MPRFRLQRINDVTSVSILDETPGFVRKKRRVGRKGLGLKYEDKVQNHFQSLYGYEYLPGPWFEYSVRERPKVVNYAQPDGLLIRPQRGLITIVEIKYSHCADSYFQLIDKYLPLCQAFFGTDLWSFALCEVVKWYDRDVSYPTPVRLRDAVDKTVPNEIGVHICRPDRLK